RNDPQTGQAIVAFVTLKGGREGSPQMIKELRDHVGKVIGKFAAPANIVFTPELPKTRSGKIMRRLLRDVSENRPLGDTTTLADHSSFAVAFSYISPSTGIFTLFILGLALAGPFFWWSWPIVVIGQLIIALNFAEVSSHFPVAGSVYQWTKYLSNRTYSWFTGWIYLFAGVLTVAAVVATVPLVLIPLLNNLGMNLGTDTDTNRN